MRHIAVLDIGKTNAKVLRVDLATGEETRVFKTPNLVRPAPPYPHYDTEALWGFFAASLKALAAEGPVDAISITTHGAAAALVDGAGALVLPVLDYEFPDPGEDADYAALRPGFAETGSPRLPLGLNLGAQIHWLERHHPQAFARAVHCLMYPQYWAMRLTGVAASEATSLGCHTDLWSPWEGRFSSLVRGRWEGLFPELRPASDHAALRDDLAAAWGLRPGLPVHFGLHDSNASLLPYLAEAGPCAVVSSGTWMICMALGGQRVALDQRRDVLINVNAKGEPTPTARYMGGREFEEMTGGQVVAGAKGAVPVPLPSRHPECGPFPGLLQGALPSQSPEDRTRSASWYAGLMTAECLGLIGAEGPIHVEGPFGANLDFARMLATATGRPVIAAGQSAGTGLGAALLAGPILAARSERAQILPDPALVPVVEDWRAQVAELWSQT
ncbi:FGGY-family carbohydrate kinase [Stagnihabitans tardus]|uniref:Carbohydrate kinase n=1 Tax=Stagnihabitans tardus TaxID=2699202 RepID=A0AAE4Y737_9RHOB|nr:FGGY family carbohydrate kinase [Stagnihabitans tardus]NBZ87087.1 carbohydrate kinase [Stagnihabitans tardus]